jgi:hypothetical protein
MAYRRPDTTRRMIFIWGLLGGLICLFTPPSWTGKLQLAYSYVFSWPLEAGHRLSRATGGLPSLHATNTPGNEGWMNEKQSLENHIANLDAQLREAHRQIDQLARLRVKPQWEQVPLLPADTIPGHTPEILFINRGSKDDVAVGQYVLGDMSIIGTVSDVFARRAKVRLITDPASKIPVTIGEAGVPGVMEGRPGGVAKIPLVPAMQTVRRGDKVLAKKTPGLLDVPIVAGTVTQCRPDPENPLLLDITVQPACDVTTLETVAVIRPEAMQD